MSCGKIECSFHKKVLASLPLEFKNLAVRNLDLLQARSTPCCLSALKLFSVGIYPLLHVSRHGWVSAVCGCFGCGDSDVFWRVVGRCSSWRSFPKPAKRLLMTGNQMTALNCRARLCLKHNSSRGSVDRDLQMRPQTHCQVLQSAICFLGGLKVPFTSGCSGTRSWT